MTVGLFILFAITNAFNICFFEREVCYIFRGVGLGVKSVNHCHQEVKELTKKNGSNKIQFALAKTSLYGPTAGCVQFNTAVSVTVCTFTCL